MNHDHDSLFSPSAKAKAMGTLVLMINSISHHQGAPVLFCQEGAINKYDWPTKLEYMFCLRERPEHTIEDMPQRVPKIHPYGVHKPFQARVVVMHCT